MTRGNCTVDQVEKRAVYLSDRCEVEPWHVILLKSIYINHCEMIETGEDRNAYIDVK